MMPLYFCVMVVNTLLSLKVPVEVVQHLIGRYHSSTAQFYHRSRQRITAIIVVPIPC